MNARAHYRQQLAIANDLACLVQVRDLVRQGVIEGRFPDQFLNRLQIAVDEAVTNIIVHGYEEVPVGTATIDIVVDVSGERFRIEIIDQGQPFDPGLVADVDIARHVEAGHAGGLGVYLMRRIMDQVDYHCRDTRNRLTMVKMRE